MRWQRGRRSANLEDRRGQRVGRGTALGAGVGLPVLAIAAIVTMCTGGGGSSGVDLGAILEQLGAAPPAGQAGAGEALPDVPDPDAELVDFMSFVLDDTQALWAEAFRAGGATYRPATLVLYEQGTQTGCGYGTAAVGPFYCPADEGVYLDLSFFRQLHDRFGAPGDFAQAYVIAHEIGHHVQQLLGVSRDVTAAQQRDPDRANELSVRLELQADCFAGVWGHSTSARDLLEPGDLEEGLQAAAAVGDDAIQSGAGAPVNPETWTHGSSEQRTRWFRTGFESGDPQACDTFAGDL